MNAFGLGEQAAQLALVAHDDVVLVEVRGHHPFAGGGDEVLAHGGGAVPDAVVPRMVDQPDDGRDAVRVDVEALAVAVLHEGEEHAGVERVELLARQLAAGEEVRVGVRIAPRVEQRAGPILLVDAGRHRQGGIPQLRVGRDRRLQRLDRLPPQPFGRVGRDRFPQVGRGIGAPVFHARRGGGHEPGGVRRAAFDADDHLAFVDRDAGLQGVVHPGHRTQSVPAPRLGDPQQSFEQLAAAGSRGDAAATEPLGGGRRSGTRAYHVSMNP